MEGGLLGSIDKQPNGRYRARYRDLNGRSRSQSFATKGEARRFLDRNSADMQRGDWVDPTMRRTRFEDWATTWWETTRKLRPSTRRGYHQLLHVTCSPTSPGRRLSEIDYLDVEQFIAAKLDEGLSAKKVRDAVSVLSMVMKSAVRSNARKDNPAAGHHIDVPSRKLTSGDVLSMADVHRLVAVVAEPYKPAIWLMILTGIRPAELCGLRVGAVDFVRHVVHVHETLQPIHAFGDHPYRLVTGPTKTDAGDRRIPIPAWLTEQMAEMLVLRASTSGRTTNRDDYLFVRPYGGPLERDKFRQSVIRPALRAAGLPDTLRTYDLRHSHASLLIDRGANVLAVAQRMGHSDPTVTLRVYGHLFDGVQESLTAELDQLRRDSESASADRAVVNIRPRRRANAPA
jgi:integrase